ncbi:ABC transporter permease [Xanthobacteraceae bacterium Astr-EGSB]|uniref:ABC transporter permease n=1 Tax=Astrobacterium formosum TaxID=3069710 RepID=UPI0027B50C57|nr:ABC transporter permease [Xanthobacteraceae bacterium Astr-EGSB]
MSLRYALHELDYRRGRSLVTVLSIAVSVLSAVLLTAVAASYARAVRAPVETVGADMVVQLTGDIPPELKGIVFPHPNALLPANAIAAIAQLPGVISVTRGVYMWELASDHYAAILGLADGEAGLGSFPARLIDGRPLRTDDRAVILDSDFAAKSAFKVGGEIDVAGTTFPVAGIVDAARGGKVARADVYMPLAAAQRLAAAAPMVQALYPFRDSDANLLLVKVDRQHLEEVVDKTVALLGKKGIVSSELSMRDALSGVLFLSQRMGLIVALVIGVFAAAFVLRATASAVAERRRELAVLQAIGWPWRCVRRQVLLENGLLALAGVGAGLVMAAILVGLLGEVSVSVELPWDLSSTPHFIPEATLDRTQTITVPISLPWETAAIAGLGGIAVALASAFALARSAPAHPWSLLRNE